MKIKTSTLDAYKLFHDGVQALARAERQGIRVDVDYCRRKKKQLTRQIEFHQKQLEETAFFKRWRHIYGPKTNVHSNHQLSNLLYKHMKLKSSKTTDNGQGSTDEDALRHLGIPELETVLQIRRLTKVRDTYLGSFIRETNADGFMRPSFNLHLVRTFRSSSSDPNFQNIPKRDKESMKICRQAFKPRPGHLLVEADFSSLEVMLSACYHKDPVMMKYLNDPEADLHGDMAKQIFVMKDFDKSIPSHNILRQATKNGFVFPQFYGDYFANNARSLCEWVKLPQRKWKTTDGIEIAEGLTIGQHFHNQGIKSFDAFVDHMKHIENDFWNNRFKVYGRWKTKWVDAYRKTGALKMFTGFTCSGQSRKNEIINYPVQGSAFHCLLWSFIALDKVLQEGEWRTKLIGQIHDSIVMDVHPDELPKIKDILDRIVQKDLPKAWPWIIVPLDIEVEAYEVDGAWIK